jgi:MFS family permease
LRGGRLGRRHLTDHGIWSAPYGAITVANLTVVALAAFDGLGVVAALPGIAQDLGSVSLLPWVITVYLAASAIAALVAGPIIDAWGVRTTFRLSGVWFLVSTAAAALAPTMPTLIAARALQGVGGGLVIAVALAGVGVAYPPQLRPRAFAANSMVWGVMGFGGPALAGLLLALGSWRWVLMVQVPLTLVALTLGWRTLPHRLGVRARLRIDVTGVLLVGVLTVASLVAVGQVGARWWLVVAAVGATVLAGAGVWWHAGRSDSPLLERRHLVASPVGLIHLTTGAVLVAGLVADNYLPIYVQITRGWSDSAAAFSLVFLTVGWTLGAVAFSRLSPTWSESQVSVLGGRVLIPGLVVAGLGIAIGAPLAVVFVGFAAVGVAIGLVSTSGLTLLQAVSDPGEMGRVTSAHQFIRTLCITYAVAIGGALMLFVVDRQVGDVEVIRQVLAGDVDVDELQWGPATADAVSDGLATAVGFGVAVGLVVMVLTTRLRRRQPRRIVS